MALQAPAALFGNARTALRHGLVAQGLRPGEVVLLPDFVCDVLLHPLEQLGLRPVYYPLNDALCPDWAQLSALAGGARALVFVHYFGQPADIERYRELSASHRLLLVEDNAHGHGGRLLGRELGTFGDIGISSPRKILQTSSGGLLYAGSRSHETAPPPASIRGRANLTDRTKAVIARRFPRVRTALRRIRESSRDWSDPRAFAEAACGDQFIDRSSEAIVRATDWDALGRDRRRRWCEWASVAVAGGLHPVFDSVHAESCPWAFPAYAADLTERNSWIERGLQEGFTAFPWPSLPEAIIQANGDALNRWRRLVCIALDRGPSAGTR